MSLATVGIVVRGTPCCPRRDRPNDAPHFGRVYWQGIGGIDVQFVQSDSDTREKRVSKKLEYGAGGGGTLAAMSGDEYANSGGRWPVCASTRVSTSRVADGMRPQQVSKRGRGLAVKDGALGTNVTAERMPGWWEDLSKFVGPSVVPATAGTSASPDMGAR